MAASSIGQARKKLLQSCNSWAKCLSTLSRSYGKKSFPASPDQSKKFNEKESAKEKIVQLLDEIYSPPPVRNTEQEYFKTHCNPDWEGHKRSVFESRFYSKKHGISNEVKSWLYWDININDNMYLETLAEVKEFMQLKLDQRYRAERTEAVGLDLGAAHFIVARGGAIKFTSRDIWFAKNAKGEYSLPRVFVEDLFLEAIDASNMKLTHVGFDNLEGLERLRYLRFHQCPHINDWCLARLHRLKDSLEFLDISDCPVTDQGLLSLHHLKNLKCLKLSNLPKVKNLGLITLLLEENIPGLTVMGVTEEDMKPPAWSHRGERRLVRALLGLMDGEEEKEQPEFIEIGKNNEDLKRYARRVDS